MSPDGEYKFSLDMLSAAHQWNRMQVERSIFHRIDTIIVANTFISHWEMKDYLEMGHDEYEVQIIRTPGPWDAEVSFKRNKHNVPLEVLQRHISKYKIHDDESEWEDMTIFTDKVWTATN